MNFLKGVDPRVIARTVITLIAFVNSVLLVNGYHVIPIDNDAVENFITMGFSGVMTLIVWWKDNPFTKAAIASNKVLQENKIKVAEAVDTALNGDNQ